MVGSHSMDDTQEIVHVEQDSISEDTSRDFEFGYMLRAEEDNEAIKEIIIRNGGVLVRMEHVRRVSLAYPIKKQEVGFFGVCIAHCNPAVIRQIEKEAQLDVRVLRLLVLAEQITQRLGAERGQVETGEQKQEAPIKREVHDATVAQKTKEQVATNEELEKKLEEMLG